MRTQSYSLGLRAGDWVEIRPIYEILATLDSEGCLDNLPFMPEMAEHCGQRFRVFKVAHKTCDTIETFNTRRMKDAVHLEGLRCDGSHHGRCQAGCLLFWKDAWLKRVDSLRRDETASEQALGCDLQALERATCVSDDDGEVRYRCQATEIVRATTRMPWWRPIQYVQDLTSGNVKLGAFIRSVAIELYNKVQHRLRLGMPYPSVRGRAKGRTDVRPLDLRAGEVVKARPREEIMGTLNAEGKNRGLSFDVEMLRYCGGTFRVLRRVEQIIDEKTGKMIKMRNDCIILDGVVCSGLFCRYRLFCPRSIYPYWREAWLQRTGSGSHDGAS